ncbi:MAG: hypothetical protein K9L71_04290, partial [Candidatus Omnitrophica bacterium]|nr:hypothetical protein [Candidatus Omnitrophota bacterium]
GMISGVQTAEYKEIAYQPACDVNRLTMKEVVNALEDKGSDNIPVAKTKQLEVLSKKLQAFNKTIEKSANNMLLKDI